jgi:two-component system response regulator AtoC
LFRLKALNIRRFQYVFHGRSDGRNLRGGSKLSFRGCKDVTSILKGQTILVSQRELDVRDYLEMSLTAAGYLVEFAEDRYDVLSFLRDRGRSVGAVLLDQSLSNCDGLETLLEIRRRDAELPVIVVSDSSKPASVVSAMRCGATDFLAKPVERESLTDTLEKAINSRRSRTRANLQRPFEPCAFFGNAPRIREIQAVTGKIGLSEESVLIQGETGSGKEVLARELHRQSRRADKPFLKLNCAALPSELVESELFGYEKGAFTGAFQKKPGMFEMANGGAILLDEIGDMDVKLQAKLLQVLQDQEFHRIGGTETIRVDVRVIAATHRDLEQAIIDKAFREDLYYRLNIITLKIPPLRERLEDILPLAEFMWRKHAGIGTLQMTPTLRQVFSTYPWPGNVRELENTVRRLIVLSDPDAIASELLMKLARSQNGATPNQTPSVSQGQLPAIGPTILEEVNKAKQQAEADAILSVLNATRWNRKQAASLLKVDYKALLYKMKKLGLDDKVVAIGHKSTRDKSFAATGTD